MGGRPSDLLRGRFGAALDQLVARLNASIHIDRRLAPEDVEGSMAHARMLGDRGILPRKSVRRILRTLPAVLADFEAGRIELDESLEDVHMHIEKALTDRIGEDGQRLHTARSRNDQVATDLRLYLLRRGLPEVREAITALMRALVDQAERHTGTVMPGYTHLQRAQPVTLGHHLLAHVEALDRDRGRLDDAARRMDACPLGSGALAATPFPIDRRQVARDLGFRGPTRNSMDAVAARDHVIEVAAAVAIAMSHLSRLAEEIVLWASSEFAFVTLDDAYCTGSSIMPQKKNPDVAELVRGKSGRAYGNLVTLLTVVKSLPLAYDKDLQEDKEALFDSIDTARDAFRVMAGLIETARFDVERMRAALRGGFLTATDLADLLVERGVPFRQAHRIVGGLVAECVRRGVELHALPDEVFAAAHPALGRGVRRRLDPERSVAARDVLGGPAPRRVRAEVRRWKRRLG